MSMVPDFVEVNGARLFVEQAGSGEAVVLIHGFSLDLRMWQDQFETLARRFRVIRYDLRGFGRSSLPTSMPYSHAADLKALLDVLHIQKAHLVGLSLGGSIALNFALSYPERLDRLVLADSVLGGYVMSAGWDASVKPVWDAGRQGDVATARRLWMANPLFAPALSNDHSRLCLNQIVTEYSGWHWTHHDPEQDPNYPAFQHLGTIRAKTLVIVGERDLLDFKAIAELLRKNIPTAEKVVLPGAGHMANMEAPGKFNSILLDFLG